MRTRSQARRLRQHHRQQQQVPPNLVEPPKDTMADNRTMAELLQAPTEGYEDAIVVPEIEAASRASPKFITPEAKPLLLRALLLDKQTSPVPAPAPVKAVEQSCVTCGGAHSYRNCPATDSNNYRDNIQEYVSQAAAANFNQGNSGYRPPPMANQIRPPSFPPMQHNNKPQ
ncbi:hypothetical protein Tco_0615995, partial [Tanacetum coccineum]